MVWYGIAAGNDRFAVTDWEQVYVFNQDGTGEVQIPAPADNTSGYLEVNIAIGGTSLFVADYGHDI